MGADRHMRVLLVSASALGVAGGVAPSTLACRARDFDHVVLLGVVPDQPVGGQRAAEQADDEEAEHDQELRVLADAVDDALDGATHLLADGVRVVRRRGGVPGHEARAASRLDAPLPRVEGDGVAAEQDDRGDHDEAEVEQQLHALLVQATRLEGDEADDDRVHPGEPCGGHDRDDPGHEALVATDDPRRVPHRAGGPRVPPRDEQIDDQQGAGQQDRYHLAFPLREPSNGAIPRCAQIIQQNNVSSKNIYRGGVYCSNPFGIRGRERIIGT